MQLFNKRYKTGLALSGGGARGIAHLGILQAMEERKIKINIISGTSAGALAGAFYADGFHPLEILDFFSNRKLYEFMRISFPRSGFFKSDALRKILEKNLRSKYIEDLNIPLIVAATNFQKGKIEYFSKGLLVDLLLASSGIPLLFETTQIDHIPYIDGGIMDNLPLAPLKKICRKTIAAHVNPIGHHEKIRNPVQVMERSFHLAVASEINKKKKEADVFIEPEGLKKYGLLDLRKVKEIYAIGYETARKQLNEM